jgi:hypothetical protein
MKLRVLNIIFGLFMAACIATSCLDSDVIEYEYSSDASITSFYIVDSIVTKEKAVVDGIDTTVSKAVLGANYPFIIDQNRRLIYNADSLPVGTDVSRVVVGITADTYGIYVVAETDSLWEEGDSLNFEKPVQFRVVSELGTLGQVYTAHIHVHQQDPNTLSWQKMESNFPTGIKAQKAVLFNDRMLVFAEQASQVALTQANVHESPLSWSTLESIDIPVKADYTSVMAWGEQLYILAENELYTSSNGLNWEKVNTTQSFSQLLGNIHTSNCQKIMAVDADNHYMESTDGTHWESYQDLPADFPRQNLSLTYYPLATNPSINRIVLLSDHAAESDTTSVVWTQLCDEHEWIPLTTGDESYLCPKMENPSIIHYDNQLYAFGGQGQDNGLLTPFGQFYVSDDNGISWSPATENMTFPAAFKDLYEEAEGNYSCIVDKNHFIWIIWSQTGEVWRGRVNKFGFDNQ